MKTLLTSICVVISLCISSSCANNSTQVSDQTTTGCDTCKSFAVYAEFAAKENKRMKDSLNRRIYTRREREQGNKIALLDDGSVSLQKGTYHISGFSMVTMEATTTPVITKDNYPGYCIVYYAKDETAPDLWTKNLCIGSIATSDGLTPSLFDFIYTCDSVVSICVGHQSGFKLNDPIYLSVFAVGKDTSSYHVFSRISIVEL